MPLTLLILGGGAAGFFAAITAAETDGNAQVILLEKSRQLLAKVRVSGGGRCNVTHACFDPALLAQNYPRGGEALRGPFTRFGPRETVAWFESRSVRLKTEPDGRMFPVTDDAQTIVNCLIDSARRAGAEIRTEAGIESVERSESGFEIRLRDGEVVRGDRVLIATGGNRQGHQWAAGLGHTIVPPVPSLFTFNIRDSRLAGLAGVSAAKTELRLGKRRQVGPTLITHWGLSGPAVLKLSAWGARELHEHGYRAELNVNWLPDYDEAELTRALKETKTEHPRRTILSHTPLPLPQRLWERLAAAAGVAESRRWAELSKSELRGLVDQLLNGKYQIAGKSLFKEEFVTCGGVSLKEVNFKTMESRICPGLYFAGEILDIDGLTGGFNFQSAWTTGWLAGRAMSGYFIHTPDSLSH